VIEPVQADAALLEDVARAAAEPGLHLWWLGQSGFLLRYGAHALLLDPYLSDTLTEKYRGTDLEHVRMVRRPVAPEALAFVDAVAASHHHTDHLDPGTLRPLCAANPRLVVVAPRAHQALVAERAAVPRERVLAVDDGEEVEVAGFRLLAVAQAHEELARDAEGRCLFLGYLVAAGPFRVYHSGDTVDYPGLAERLAPHRPDVALLPINGRAAGGRVPANLDGPGAAALARAMGARLAVPCHYDMFTFNTASPEGFARAAEALGQPYRVLRVGERLALPEPAP